MASKKGTLNRSARISSRKLVMEYCPKCHLNTAFEFNSDSSDSKSCLDCGHVKKAQQTILETEQVQ